VTDSKLRELERRWKETGSVEDEARYLLERVRVGDLERERLELAAYCGHEGARWALDVPSIMDNEERLLQHVEAADRDLLPLFAFSAAAEVLTLWETHFPDETAPRATLGALQAWLEEGSVRARQDLPSLGKAVLQVIKRRCDRTRPSTPAERAGRAIGLAAFAPLGRRYAKQAISEARYAVWEQGHALCRLWRRAAMALLA